MKHRKNALLMCVIMALAIVGCSEEKADIPEGWEQEDYNKCQKVLDTINGYLDTNISAEDAMEKLEILGTQLRDSEIDDIHSIGMYAYMTELSIKRYIESKDEEEIDLIMDCREGVKGVLEKNE